MSEQNEPVYFAALTLAIVTLRASKQKAEFCGDNHMAENCVAELEHLNWKRDSLEAAMQTIGGA